MALNRTWLRPTLLIRMLLVLGLATALLSTVMVQAQDGGVLRVALNAPQNLDPALNGSDTETAFNLAIYDLLVDVLPDGSIAPNLASAWEISDDNLTYTFTLQEGVTFQDGTPFTSADVVWSFNRLVEVGSPATGLLGEFEVSAPDDSTVVFTLSEVNADFIYGVGSRWAFIIRDGQDQPNVLTDGDNPYVNFNGTGPFVLTEYSAEDRSVFSANENYWREGEPKLAGLEFIYIADPVAQVDALLGGDVDVIYRAPSTQLERLDGADNVSVVQTPTAQHAVIRLRTDEGPGESVEVRQALKLATDRDELNNVLLNGRGIVANNDPIGPAYPQFYNDTIEKPAYDPEQACQLIQEAGYTDGLNMTLYVPNAFEYPDLATLLQQQWDATGCITVDIQVREENLYYDTSNPENYFDVELGITGWGARPVPQQYLQEAYASDAPYNETRWSDPELDDLIAQARATTDQAARRDIYTQISQIFADRGPIIVPYFAPLISATAANVTGINVNPYPGLTDYREASFQG